MNRENVIRWDGESIFGSGEQRLKSESWRREKIERGFAGVDGVWSVDLGRRERVIRQRGILRAESAEQLRRQIDVIEDAMDGQEHSLIDLGGQTFSHVWMDRFTPLGEMGSGSQVSLEYEILYTQLGE